MKARSNLEIAFHLRMTSLCTCVLKTFFLYTYSDFSLFFNYLAIVFSKNVKMSGLKLLHDYVGQRKRRPHIFKIRSLRHFSLALFLILFINPSWLQGKLCHWFMRPLDGTVSPQETSSRRYIPPSRAPQAELLGCSLEKVFFERMEWNPVE